MYRSSSATTSRAIGSLQANRYFVFIKPNFISDCARELHLDNTQEKCLLEIGSQLETKLKQNKLHKDHVLAYRLKFVECNLKIQIADKLLRKVIDFFTKELSYGKTEESSSFFPSHGIFFSDLQRDQIALSCEICKLKFQKGNTALLELIESIRWDREQAQENLRIAIERENVFEGRDFSIEVASRISWDREPSQTFFAQTLCEKWLKAESQSQLNDLLADDRLIALILKTQWTSPLAQEFLVRLVFYDWFECLSGGKGINDFSEHAQKSIQSLLEKINWTSQIAQYWISWGILSGKLNGHSEFIASIVNKINWTDPEAQVHISRMILEERIELGSKEILSLIIRTDWRDYRSLRNVAKIFYQEKMDLVDIPISFKDLERIVQTLSENPRALELFAKAVLEKKLGFDDNVKRLTRELASVYWCRALESEKKDFLFPILKFLSSVQNYFSPPDFETLFYLKYLNQIYNPLEFHSEFMEKKYEGTDHYIHMMQEKYGIFCQKLNHEFGIHLEKTDRTCLYQKNQRWHLIVFDGVLAKEIGKFFPGTDMSQIVHLIKDEYISVYTLVEENGDCRIEQKMKVADGASWGDLVLFLKLILTDFDRFNHAPCLEFYKFFISNFEFVIPQIEDGFSEDETKALRKIFFDTITTRDISSASSDSALKRKYNDFLMGKISDEVHQKIISEIEGYCTIEGEFDEEKFLFAAHSMGVLASASGLGWETTDENESNSFFRRLCELLIAKLVEAVDRNPASSLKRSKETLATVLEMLPRDQCIQTIMGNIDSNRYLEPIISAFYS